MNKDKMKKLIIKYKKISSIMLRIYNRFNINNKLHTKGIKLINGFTQIKGLKISCRGVNNKIIIKDNCRVINSIIIIHGSNNEIFIDDYVFMKEVELVMEDDNNKITIGKSTSLCGRTHLAAIEGTSIVIGSRCLLSSDLHFRTGDSHSIIDMEGQRINKSKNIIIGDHVWIGTKVTCLKGVTILDNCVVDATTTLCRQYKSTNCIIAGVPGCIIKEGINWDMKRI